MYWPEILAIVGLAIIATTTVVLLIIPKTRPYVKKYWWAALAAVLVFVGAYIGARASRRKPEDPKPPDPHATDDVIAKAQANVKEIEHQLEIKKIKNSEDRKAAEAKLDQINKEPDVYKRLEQLAKLTNEY
jgi:hypothetical protein